MALNQLNPALNCLKFAKVLKYFRWIIIGQENWNTQFVRPIVGKVFGFDIVLRNKLFRQLRIQSFFMVTFHLKMAKE